MSKELEARVDRLETIIMGLMDEIVEFKELRHEIQTNHVNQQLAAKREADRLRIEIQNHQLNAQMASAQRTLTAQQSADMLYGLGSLGPSKSIFNVQSGPEQSALGRLKDILLP